MTVPNENIRPTVFISYANDEENLAQRFALRLQADLANIYQIKAVVADTDNRAGKPVNDFGVKWAKQADWIVCVCTPEYLRKSANGSGCRLAPEFEAIMQRDQKKGDNRVIPVLLEGDSDAAVPDALENRVRIDFRVASAYERSRAELVKEILPELEDSLPETPIEGGTKLILVADVDGFSELDTVEQKHIMEQIWPKLAEIGGSPPSWEAVFPILDGFGMVWKDVLAYPTAVDVARRIVDGVLMEDGNKALRCGLHYGVVMTQAIKDKRTPHFYGSGVNDAGRACGLGDAGDIILTEVFCNAMRNANRKWQRTVEVDPEPHLEGFMVFPNRGQRGIVRVLRSGKPDLPSRLELRRRAEERFKELIAEVALEYAEAIEEIGGKEMDYGSLRVTYWRLATDLDNKLWSSGISMRWKFVGTEADEKGEDVEIWETDAPDAKERSKILYSVLGTGEGPPGMAWVAARENAAVVAHNLPLVHAGDKVARETYDLVLQRDFGMRPETVREFSRTSRFIGACAFPNPHVASHEAMGVLCIDLDVEIPATVSRRELEEMLAMVMSNHSTDLFLASKFRT